LRRENGIKYQESVNIGSRIGLEDAFGNGGGIISCTS
jgi:hypothetical protein